jgi:hypothetical protein
MPKRRQIRAGGTRGTLFQAAAIFRLRDADALLENKRYSGAVYLAGYAVECILKWAVTSRRKLIYLPEELETHNWDMLLAGAGLNRSLQGDPELAGVFAGLADRWGPELRYSSEFRSAREAETVCQQMAELYNWVREQA